MTNNYQLMLSELPFEVPKNAPTVNFKTNLGEFIVREPLAYDFRCLDELTEGITNKYDRFFIILDRLGVSIGGKPVTLNDIAGLDINSFQSLMTWITEVYAKLIPKLSPEMMLKLGITDADLE